MIAKDVYALPVVHRSTGLYELSGLYHTHVPEIGALSGVEQQTPRIEIRYHINHSFDGRRVWRLGSVWLDEMPVMIIQNAGREGDDFHRRFITDYEKYKELVVYLRSLEETGEPDNEDVVNVDEEISVEFYRHRYTEFVNLPIQYEGTYGEVPG